MFFFFPLSEPNKEKTDYRNGEAGGGGGAGGGGVNHSPKSSVLLSPGSVPLPGLTHHHHQQHTLT
ncbi:MAG: hypothetical protein ACK56I_11995, partial [bacterium]